MVRELNMDTQRQNFWKESIHKEATVRLAWHMRFSKEFADKKLFETAPRKEKKSMVKPVKLDVKNICNFARNSNKKSILLPDITATKTDPVLLVLDEMRPVSGNTRKLLYKGFSALGEGRYAYLQERKRKKPEQKYEFPITSGWEYGWRITDAMKRSSAKPAEFGRTRIVRDSFYRSNGVLPHGETTA